MYNGLNLDQLISCLPADIQILTSSDLSSALIKHTDLGEELIAGAVCEWKEKKHSQAQEIIQNVINGCGEWLSNHPKSVKCGEKELFCGNCLPFCQHCGDSVSDYIRDHTGITCFGCADALNNTRT